MKLDSEILQLNETEFNFVAARIRVVDESGFCGHASFNETRICCSSENEFVVQTEFVVQDCFRADTNLKKVKSL